MAGAPRTVALLWMSACVALGTPPVSAECPPLDPGGPRTLILALDGVPYRCVRTAREMGAFAGWAPVQPLVSTFPSMTNVGFAAILAPFGAGTIPGYEVRLYDSERNRIAPQSAVKPEFDWRDRFQVRIGGVWDKTGLYLTPRRSAMREMRHVRRFVLERPDEVMLALVSSTDALTHFHGDRATIDMLMRLSEKIEALRARHLALHGRPLRVVMVSDHGNAPPRVRRPDGVLDLLRGAGLRPARRLERADDVVAVTYGLVGYGALYLDPSRAETAARAVLGQAGVQLAAWSAGERELRLVAPDGEASIEGRGPAARREYRYRARSGDPLGLGPTLELMRGAGVLDEDGFAARDAWFDWTAREDYPDGVPRLAESLDGTWVRNPATVIFSYEPGWAWGLKKVQVAAWLRAGRLEATHGGLDRESTWGFFLASDAAAGPDEPVRADRALARWAELGRCTSASLLGFSTGTDALHSARPGR